MATTRNFITNDTRVVRDKEIIFQDIQDELIILNIKDENYLGLDNVGTRFWNILLNSSTTKDAYDKIMQEYDVEPNTLRTDLNSFISELIENKLVKIISV